MCEHCPQEVFDVDPDVPMILVSCPKCREVAVYVSATTAARAAVHHAKKCGTSLAKIIEVMAVAEDTGTARAHN